MAKRFHIVFFTSREKDLPYLAVAIRSLVDHFSDPAKLDIHFLYYDLESSERGKLLDSVADLPCGVREYDLEPMLGDRIEQPGFGFWAYFWIVKLLPPEVERVLYLDCDMMVYDDITPLLETEITDHVLAAAVDPGAIILGNQPNLAQWARENGHPYDPSTTPYFNAGMLLLNLRVWRDENLLEFLDERFRNNYHCLPFHDQDALNLFFGTRAKMVSARWNLLEILEFWDEWDFEIQAPVDRPENYFEPAIKHFAGFQKPDTSLIRISDRVHYYSYLDQTVWRGWRADCARSFKGRVISELLEFRYVLLRGFGQKALKNPWGHLWKVLSRSPYIPFFYPLFYLNRAVHRVKAALSKTHD